MVAFEKRNWGLGFLLSVALAAGMILRSYNGYQEAQNQCFNCFEGRYDFLKNAQLPRWAKSSPLIARHNAGAASHDLHLSSPRLQDA